MNPISLIPVPYRIFALSIAIILVLGAIYARGHADGATGVQARWDSEKVILQQAAYAAEVAARTKEQSLMNKITEAQNAATERETKLRADYAAAHAAAVSLRDTVAAIRSGLPGDTVESCRSTADTALTVLSECQARYGAVAEAADGHASDVQTLIDGWPK